MTPKFKYDPEHDCLREVVVNEWILTCPCDSCMKTRASLISIECQPGSFWPEGELENEVDFFVNGIIPIAFPITPQPRLYTQAEAEEIFKDAYRMGMTYKMGLDIGIESPLEHEQQQYFKTRFNVDITPQIPNQ